MTIIGIWLAAVLTLCIYSFLYKDNPFFKFAEHLFVGVSAGYLLVIVYYTNFLPYIYYPLKSAVTENAIFTADSTLQGDLDKEKLPEAMRKEFKNSKITISQNISVSVKESSRKWIIVDNDNEKSYKVKADNGGLKVYIGRKYSEFVVLLPMFLGVMMFSRFVPKYGWLVRWPFAFLMGYNAGVDIPAIMQTDIFQQIHGTAEPFSSLDGFWAVINSLLIMLGVICTLMYFFFSKEHKGIMGGISEIGIIFLMIGFGASFGYTVMARISLLIGRIDFLLNLPFTR